LFPAAGLAMDALVGQLHGLLYACMFRPIARLLAGFERWSSVWAGSSGSSGAGGLDDQSVTTLPLPSFSLQPSDYMVQLGEHLLTTVQQLEPFTRAEDEEEEQDGEQLNEGEETQKQPRVTVTSTPTGSPLPPVYVESDALYWLQLLSAGTFRLLLSRVLSVPVLSPRGARQLATDLDYLLNVLLALGIAAPTLAKRLAHWLHCSEQDMSQALAAGHTTSAAADATMTTTVAAGATATDAPARIVDMQPEEKQMLRHIIKARRWKP